MKKYILPIVIAIGLLSLTSCAVFTNKGKAAKAEEESRTNIDNVENKISSNISDKMDEVGILAYGTDIALNKVDEPTVAVEVAKDMNKRVMSLSGSPSLEKMKEMQDTIDKLTSDLDIERVAGKTKLNIKDAEITKLQNETKFLTQARDAEIRKYMGIAQQAAANADAYKSELDKMDSFMGLGAVWYGLKKFVVRSMWILGIGSILFMVLRIASMSNPIAASIFSIFNVIGSWVVNGIKLLVPKALEFAGNTATSVFNAYRGTMYKIIDGIQTLKEQQRKTGDPTKKFTLDELMEELTKTMSDEDKKRIVEIKREIGYH
jgi:bacterioferritin (cytochrome b1)